MKKTVNSHKTNKDHILNNIMQEIDREHSNPQTTNSIKTKPQKSSWGKWLVNFILLLTSMVFIFVLIPIYQATKEVSNKEPVMVKSVTNNHNADTEHLVKNPITPVNTVPKSVQKDLLIFTMKAKAPVPHIEKENNITLEKTTKSETPLSEREKAKALLRKQMNH